MRTIQVFDSESMWASSLMADAEFVASPVPDADHACGMLVIAYKKYSHVRPRLHDESLRCQDIHGVVRCFYVNPLTGRYWLVEECSLLQGANGEAVQRQARLILFGVQQLNSLRFSVVLADRDCASAGLMVMVEQARKAFWCHILGSRRLGSIGSPRDGQLVERIEFDGETLSHGKILNLAALPEIHCVRLFRLILRAGGVEHAATNHWSQADAGAARLMCGVLKDIKAAWATIACPYDCDNVARCIDHADGASPW